MVIPASAGPFDLGLVVVRGSIAVDFAAARLTIATGSFPASLQGVPLRVKNLSLDIDRPGFMIDPTDCAAEKITGSWTPPKAPVPRLGAVSGGRLLGVAVCAESHRVRRRPCLARPRRGLDLNLHIRRAQRRICARSSWNCPGAAGASDDDPSGVHCRGVCEQPGAVPAGRARRQQHGEDDDPAHAAERPDLPGWGSGLFPHMTMVLQGDGLTPS